MYTYTLDYLISSYLATYYYQAYYKPDFVLAFWIFSVVLEFVDAKKRNSLFQLLLEIKNRDVQDTSICIELKLQKLYLRSFKV